MTEGPTAYGLPSPRLVTFSEAEAIGGELHDRWAEMSGGEPPLARDDYGWADIVQWILRRASSGSREPVL